MRNFIITIEGKKYQVGVEEVESFAAAQIVPEAVKTIQQSVQPVAAQAPAAAVEKTEAKKPAPAVNTGGTSIESPMPGLILELNFKNGDTVKQGDAILVLEAMKMGNDITAAVGGIITYTVDKGASVNSGDILAKIS